MELKQLSEEVTNLFSINDISELGESLFQCVCKNDTEKYSKFCSLVEDLSVDWLQMIFQYYQADRKEKMNVATVPYRPILAWAIVVVEAWLFMKHHDKTAVITGIQSYIRVS